MDQSKLFHLSVECPNCLAVNELMAGGLLDASAVSCSQCGAPIGLWGSLRRMAGREGRKAEAAALPSPAFARLVAEAPTLARPPALFPAIRRRPDAQSCGVRLLPNPIWGAPRVSPRSDE